MPAEPWSVPPEAFSAPRRPNSDHTCTSTRSAIPRDSRSRWNASSEYEASPRSRLIEAAWPGVRVEAAHRQPDDAHRHPAGDHRGEPGEAVRERVGRARVGDRAVEAVLEVAELVVEVVRVVGGLPGLLAARRRSTSCAPRRCSPPSAASTPRAGAARCPGGAKVYWSAPCSVATGTFAVASAGCSVASSVSPCTGLSGAPTLSR